MSFPNFDWVKLLVEKCNSNAAFNHATLWSDVKIVINFGDKRYWLKLYKGEVIDLMEYLPMTNALGYDIILDGSLDAWRNFIGKTKVFWEPYSKGDITIDGNMLECNRMHESICIMADTMTEIGL